jgi:hypothetical protein
VAEFRGGRRRERGVVHIVSLGVVGSVLHRFVNFCCVYHLLLLPLLRVRERNESACPQSSAFASEAMATGSVRVVKPV